ncbi:MAG: Dna2/Cas4 domain-containing protein, partial [Bacteroidota bacterium]
TYFTEYYRHERTRSYLDNLNLLYVAFTRAERGLIALAPHPETRGAKGTVAALVHTCIQQDKDLQANWDEAELVWRAGEWTAAPTEAKETTDALKLNQYLASGWREKLVIRHTGSDYFNDTIDEQRERISYGIHMHAVLSKIRYASEINHVLNEIVLEGLITAEERNAVENEILELMNHPSVASWFTPDWEIRTEAPILIPGGGESRIDRLLINGKKAIVIDFKTGAKTKNDQQQVQQYMDVLRQMNFISIEGYLVYLRDKEVVEVKTGSKQRVVKRKNENQLEIPGLNFGAPEKN